MLLCGSPVAPDLIARGVARLEPISRQALVVVPVERVDPCRRRALGERVLELTALRLRGGVDLGTVEL